MPVSPRVYLVRLPNPECPLHWERRGAFRNGSLKFQGRQPTLNEALAAEPAERVEGEEQLWQIQFCDYVVLSSAGKASPAGSQRTSGIP